MTGVLVTLAAIYLVVWWIVLIAVLPFGVRSQAESGMVEDGTDPGAPAVPMLGRKFAVTSVIAAFVTGGIYWYATAFGA